MVIHIIMLYGVNTILKIKGIVISMLLLVIRLDSGEYYDRYSNTKL